MYSCRKETYIHANETQNLVFRCVDVSVLVKESQIHVKETYICAKETCFRGKESNMRVKREVDACQQVAQPCC